MTYIVTHDLALDIPSSSPAIKTNKQTPYVPNLLDFLERTDISLPLQLLRITAPSAHFSRTSYRCHSLIFPVSDEMALVLKNHP